ncbi:transposable element tc1 transposase [Plakobranchus ocellatus]|uniref:Transposable element tc1 transposase n=1 Tax=Plakobranchus ocellatus TaxID=259542 RepID=A0AAV4DH64_9GAST|nr:transposable element tc1 transposase [Plakobranchus ocellatus]
MIDLQSTINSLQLYIENQEKSIEILKESLNRHEIHNKKYDTKIQELEPKIKVLSSSSSSSSIIIVTPTRQSKDDSSTSPYQDVLPSKHRTFYRDVLVQKPPLQQRHLHSGSPSRSSSLSSLLKHSPLPESKSSSAINNSILHSSNDSVRPARDTPNVCEHDVTLHSNSKSSLKKHLVLGDSFLTGIHSEVMATSTQEKVELYVWNGARIKHLINKIKTLPADSSGSMENDPGLLSKIIFSDEATLHLSGKVNRHSVRILRTQSPHATL